MAQIAHAYSCPFCESTNFKLNGKYKNKQRYKCKNCNKQFRDTTNTPLHWLHKSEKADKYLKALEKGMSIRKAAKYVGISKSTSFYWRHKFLSSLSNDLAKTSDKTTTLKIIKHPFSTKGRKKPTPPHPNNTITIIIKTETQIKLQVLTANNLKKELISELCNLKDHPCTIYKPNKLIHSAIKQSENIKILKSCNLKTPKLQAIDKEESILENWMGKFRGVATKYLQHYWNWYTSLCNYEIYRNPSQQFKLSCTANRTIQHFREKIIE